MSDKVFDYTAPFKTKCGWPARLLGRAERTAYPLVVAVWNPHFHAEEVHSYGLDGKQPVRIVYASGDVPTDHTGASGGALSLVNIEHDFENSYLKATDFVYAVAVKDLEPMDLARSANPFHYDLSQMGTDLVRGWMVMHGGFDRKEDPQPLYSIDLVNCRSGQRIHINLATKKVQP